MSKGSAGPLQLLVGRLREFEFSDALGDGDFSVCIDAADKLENLTIALLDLRRGVNPNCWCEKAIGNPMVKEHSQGCKYAAALLTPNAEAHSRAERTSSAAPC